ncbi:hypothetical protein R50073_12830 [Maricurvus nonylphenolicus]
MSSPNGINHLALATTDMKAVLQFFNNVLGMPLVALYWMHGAKNTIHGFLGLNEHSTLAFVATPENPTEVSIGVTHAGHSQGVTAAGTMQRFSLNVDSLDDLLLVKQALDKQGIACSDVIDRKHIKSIGFTAIDQVEVEVSTVVKGFDEDSISTEVAKAFNISDAELSRLTKPEEYQAVEPLPANADWNQLLEYKPTFPERFMRLLCLLPDDLIMDATRDAVPPTKPQGLQLKRKFSMFKLLLASLALFIIKPHKTLFTMPSKQS